MLAEGCKVSIKMEIILNSKVKVVCTLFRNFFQYKTQEMYERTAEEDPHTLLNVPNEYSPFLMRSLIYAEKFEFENPAIMEDKQSKQTEWFSVMAKGSDYVIRW